MQAIITEEISTNQAAYRTMDVLVAMMESISKIGRMTETATKVSLVTKIRKPVIERSEATETKDLGTLPHKKSLIGVKKDYVLDVEELFILDISARIDI